MTTTTAHRGAGAMLKMIVSHLMTYLWPPRLFAGLSCILSEWRRSDLRDRGMLLLVFSPMLICTGCLLFSIASFVLFVLPSFVLSVFGWLLLISIFGGGGLYLREKLSGRFTYPASTSDDTEAYKVEAEEKQDSPASSSSQNSEPTRAWYNKIRGSNRQR